MGSWGMGTECHLGRVGMECPSLLEGDQPHHTEHLCTGFMGEFLGQWKTRPNSSNCETLPRTLPGERRTSELGTPCTAALHPTQGMCSPQQHPDPCPRDITQNLLAPALQRVLIPLCTALTSVGKAGTHHAPSPSHFGSTQYL